MPKGPILGVGAQKVIANAVDKVFDRAIKRTLGPWMINKQIQFDHNHHWSIPGIFGQAAREEGVVPEVKTLKQLMDVAKGYIDATRERTKAQAVQAVTSFLADAHRSGVETDLETVLGGKLAEIFDQAQTSMRRIVDTEANGAKNISILDGIERINHSQGIDDPIVYFVSVNDASRCEECTRLHTIDGVTPKLWKLSQVESGYHKKGTDHPSFLGLHPNCRCTIATLIPGYGFDGSGRVMYVGQGHDEYAKQQP